jgi:FkbM family methyltransferase
MKFLYFIYDLFINKFLIQKNQIRRFSEALLDLLIKQDKKGYYSNYHIKISDGRIFQGSLKNFRYKLLFWDGTFEPAETKLMSHILKADDIFFDVGANIGWYSTFAAQLLKNGKVYAFEPIEVVAQSLSSNISINRFNNVLVENLALADENSNAEINFDNDNWGLSSLKAKNNSKEKLIIQVKKLDDYVSENEIKNITVIKCDIEGAENLFLKGAENTLKRFSPIIFMEISPKNLSAFNVTPTEINNKLTFFGYSLYQIGTLNNQPLLKKYSPEEKKQQNIIAFNLNDSESVERFKSIKSMLHFSETDTGENKNMHPDDRIEFATLTNHHND